MNQSFEILSSKFFDDGKPLHPRFNKFRKTIKEIDTFLRQKIPSTRNSHKKCPLCGGIYAVVIANKSSEGLPVNRQVCKTCGLFYSAEYLLPEFVEEFYSKYFYRLSYKGDSAEELFKKRIAPESYSWKRHQYIKDYLGEDFSKIKFVIEVGCNDGCNLFPYLQEGKTVVGCDFDEERIQIGRKFGITIHKGGIDSLLDKGYRADIVILSHVFDHLTHPGDVLEKIKKITSPSSLLYIENPGIFHNTDLIGCLRFEFTFWFELETLKDFLSQKGFSFLIGDETIRCLFISHQVKDFQKKMIKSRKNRYKKVLKYLHQARNKYLRKYTGFIGKSRYLYHYLKNFNF